eukprot:CAMPEP_0172840908 /NCGR_PEP_ID=MMETSP1075-20121228/29653_1 /TAXON_ID=2916 /ORGANISM="Ceratium fusus, Strain PA161109" /LENGTH=178 /DNA_ID=CAMNT_0013684821 /DNA_START=40 /DNA_END=572 /DNA_ORIENTATION=+
MYRCWTVALVAPALAVRVSEDSLAEADLVWTPEQTYGDPLLHSGLLHTHGKTIHEFNHMDSSGINWNLRYAVDPGHAKVISLDGMLGIKGTRCPERGQLKIAFASEQQAASFVSASTPLPERSFLTATRHDPDCGAGVFLAAPRSMRVSNSFVDVAYDLASYGDIFKDAMLEFHVEHP